MKTEDATSATIDDAEDTLLARLAGANGAATRDQAMAALDKLQQELLLREREGVPPQQSRHLSAALLAVKSARATLQRIKVGTPTNETDTSGITKRIMR
jgi:hypothetical protein